MRASLARFATARPHLLVVEAAGAAAERLSVERLAREQGWAVVDTPADTDVLVVVGEAAALDEHVSRVGDQLPGPRALVRITADDDVRSALLAGRSALTDPVAQRADVRRVERPAPAEPPMGGHDMGGHDMGGHDMGGHDMGGHDMGGHDMGGHDMGGHDMGGHDMGGHDMGGHDMGGHDMGGHDMGGMALPAGLAMADRATDRDGLKLDVLTVPWGPVLAWWPEGLVLTTVLQGDVVQSASAVRIGDEQERRTGWARALADLDAPVAAAVVRLDALVRLLGVAGWEDARLRAQRVRDGLLAGDQSQLESQLQRLARRVCGSRALARMTTGLPTTNGEDVAARYRRWLTESVAAVTDGSVPPVAGEPHVLHQLPSLVTGTEVASMRLVVASLDLALSGADHRVASGA